MAVVMPDKGREQIQNWINLVCAVLLFISPWALSYSGDMAAARAAWLSGGVVTVVAIAALVNFAEWEEWIALLLGVWLILAPWLLIFSFVHAALAAFTALGVVIALSSISELRAAHHPPALAK